MNSVLLEIYTMVLPGAPYVLAIYAFVFLSLFVYALLAFRRLKKNERKMTVIEKKLGEMSEKGVEKDKDTLK